jgi:hypothetical protein
MTYAYHPLPVLYFMLTIAFLILLKVLKQQEEHSIFSECNPCLKVLFSEMDPAEIRLIRYIFIKGSVAEAF